MRWFVLVLVIAMVSTAAAADWSASTVFNGDQFGLRVGRLDDRLELGIEGLYRDDLAPDSSDAYAAGIYGLWSVNPDAAFPLRGWVPGAPEWMPESVPVELYLGVKCVIEFSDHELMPAFVLGGRVKTGVRGSIGVEYQRAFNNWDNTAAVLDTDVFMASIRYKF